MTTLTLAIVFIVFAIIWQGVVRSCMYFFNSRIEKSMDTIATELENDDYKETLIQNEIEPFKLIKFKKSQLGFISKAVGAIELFIFYALTLTLYITEVSDVEKLQYVITIFFAWMALKIFGNYQQWSGAIFGRATFYAFLIGSILNIGGAVAVGYLAFSFIL